MVVVEMPPKFTKETVTMAKMQVQQEYLAFSKKELNQNKAVSQVKLLFCLEYPNLIGADILKIIPRLNPRSLEKILNNQEIKGYFSENRKGSGLIDQNPALKEAILASLAINPKLSPLQIQRLLESQYSFESIPSYFQIRRWVQNFAQNNPSTWAKLQSENQARNIGKPAFGKRDTHISRPNQEWQLDSTLSDLFLKIQNIKGEWELKRCAVIGVIDVFSRRAKLLIAEVSNAQNIQKLIKNTILDWGLPESIKTDNGRDYLSATIWRFLGRLGVDLLRCTPFTPQEKPYIERFFGTFQHQELELLPNYCGHNVTEKSALLSNGQKFDTKTALSLSDFQSWCDQWVDNYNISAYEKLASARQTGWKAKIIDQRSLDFLGMSGCERIVSKKGIAIHNNFFVAPELGSKIGAKVWVCYEPENLSEIFIYSDSDLNRFVCKAISRELAETNLAEIAGKATQDYLESVEIIKVARKEASKLKAKIAKNPQSLLPTTKAIPFVAKEKVTPISSVISAQANNQQEKPRKEDPLFLAQGEKLLRLSEKKTTEDQVSRFARIWDDKQNERAINKEDLVFFSSFAKTPQGHFVKRTLEM